MKLSALLPDLSLPPAAQTLEISSVSCDSRDISPGAVFFALSGSEHKGTDFIEKAISKGAKAIITGKEYTGALDLPVPLFRVDNTSFLLGEAAYRLAKPLPDHLAAVTGTNGKTSCAEFLRQIWQLENLKSASIGTLGIHTAEKIIKSGHTTPPSPLMASSLHQLKENKIDHVALEASSHGLVQNRLAGLQFESAGFSSFSRDHLDYHKTEKEYLAAKLRLFETLLSPEPVIAASTSCGTAVLEALSNIAHEKKAVLRTIGGKGDFIKLLSTHPLPEGQALTVSLKNQPPISIHLPIPGLFQAHNALLAAAMAAPVQANDETIYKILHHLPNLTPIPGRAELAGKTENGAAVYIDYAHTPDALERILESLRPHLGKDGKLILVFGAGGNRDSGKRPLMGRAAQKADKVIVTDDNPRFEDPASIRKEVLAGCPKALEIPDRRSAIIEGIKALNRGDILLIAGKGHEKTQEIKGVSYPFDDVSIAREEGQLLREDV